MLLQLCCLLIFVNFDDAVAQLQVTPNGTVFGRSVGSSIIFTCFVHVDSVDSNINIQWLNSQHIEILDKTSGRDNTPYVDKSQPLMNKLMITNIQFSHSGNYFCSSVVEGNLQQIMVTLNVYADVVCVNCPTPQHPIAFSSDALIQCRVSGLPVPTVSWRFRGQQITNGGRYYQDQYGLRVRNITREDNGLYYCCAQVELTGSYQEFVIDVIVDEIPKIVQGPGPSVGIQSQQYTLQCRAHGHPNPKYEFFKDNNLAPVFSTERIQVDGDLGVINFRPLHSEDAGLYKCHTFNRAGEDFLTGLLTVLVPPTIYNIKNTTAVEGQSTTLVCLSYGDPAPDMTFKREGKYGDFVMGPNEHGRILLSYPLSGQLNMVINKLVPEDMANYTCKSRNNAGYHEKNGSITVQFSPRFRPDTPTVVYGWAGKMRNLTCRSLAEPMPLIEWVRDDRVIQNNETYRTYIMSKDSNLQITIREVDQGYIYGNFTCRAKNQQGTGTFNVELRRARLPGRPANAKVVATPTTAELSIELPEDNGGLDIFGFSVQYELAVAEFMIGDLYLIEYLEARHTYNFKVRARSELGLGDPLDVPFTTPDVSVPYPLVWTSDPQGMSSYEYVLTWEKPNTGGLPIVEYTFRLREVTVENDSYKLHIPIGDWLQRIVQDDISSPMLYYILGNLNPCTYYQLEGRAMNVIGWSNKTPEFIFSTASDLMDTCSAGSSSRSSTRITHLGVLLIVMICCHTFYRRRI